MNFHWIHLCITLLNTVCTHAVKCAHHCGWLHKVPWNMLTPDGYFRRCAGTDALTGFRPAPDWCHRPCVCEEAVSEVRPQCLACPSRLLSSSVEQSPFWAREEAGRAGLRCRRSSPLLAPTECWQAGKGKKTYVGLLFNLTRLKIFTPVLYSDSIDTHIA